MAKPRVFTAQEWGARPPTVAKFPRQGAVGIVVHNTESANRAMLDGEEEKKAIFRLARAIQANHMSRKPPYSDTGQHFTVSRGGLILEGRHGSLAAARDGQVVTGAHAGSAVHNKSWFGIEVEGDFRGAYSVTEPQWRALVELCAWLSFWGGFDSTNILGHKQVKTAAGGTDCPGHLMDRLDDLRDAVHSRKLEIISETG